MKAYPNFYADGPISAKVFKGSSRIILTIYQPSDVFGAEIPLQMELRFADKAQRIANAINAIMAEPDALEIIEVAA